MRRLTVIVCLDDRNGMTFNNRRQSRDRTLIDELCASHRGVIYINEYSLPLFEKHRDRVCVSLDPMRDCPDGGAVFAENIPLSPYLSEIEQLTVYRWNRIYPRDRTLDLDIPSSGLMLGESTEFTGSSHERITKEVYRK